MTAEGISKKSKKDEAEISVSKSKKELKKEKKEKKKKEKKDKKKDKKRKNDESSDTKKEKKRSRKESKSSDSETINESKRDESSKQNKPYQQVNPKDFRKSFYIPTEATSLLTQKEVTKFYQDHEMNVSGSNCENYNPIFQFKDAPFASNVMKCCSKFEKPTQIQSQCWPILASGRDIVGIAQTGSGKTLAFTIPGLIHILDQKDLTKVSPGPIMLVVAPTRELAMQISEVIEDAGKSCNISSVCLYGGVSKYEQQQKIKHKGVHVIVATPGRLIDLINAGHLSLSRVTYLVLDEADRMLDEGFEKDIRFIMENAHPERQIAMFSATWPKSIQQLAQEFLIKPVKVTCGSEDLVANRRIKQIVEVVDNFERDQKVNVLLKKYHKSRKNRILLFVLYKKEAARVHRNLMNLGWTCAAIHGDNSQYQRTEAVEKFKSGEIPLLIATDVAARGLDIPDVEYVINYSFPLTIEDYVHRIGRTGRAGKSGVSHTYFTAFDKPRAGELVNLLREAEQPIPDDLTKFGTHVKKKEHKLYGAFAKDIDMNKKATKIIFADSDDE